MKVYLKNDYTGRVKNVKCGYSFSTLFWGFLAPLFRGDFLTAIILAIFNVNGIIYSYGAFSFLVNLLFAAVYNKIYIKNLLKKGYTPFSRHDAIVIERYIN